MVPIEIRSFKVVVLITLKDLTMCFSDITVLCEMMPFQQMVNLQTNNYL